eukprot:608765-Rhodomonas_salina.1
MICTRQFCLKVIQSAHVGKIHRCRRLAYRTGLPVVQGVLLDTFRPLLVKNAVNLYGKGQQGQESGSVPEEIASAAVVS